MPGSIKIDDGSGNYTILTNAGSLGSDKTITIPNTTGTAALTTDVDAELLASQTVSEGVTTEIDFSTSVTGFNHTDYSSYMVTYSNWQPTDDSRRLYGQLFEGATAFTGTYNQGGNQMGVNTNSGPNYYQKNDTSYFDVGYLLVGTDTREGVSGYIRVFPGNGSNTGSGNNIVVHSMTQGTSGLVYLMDLGVHYDAAGANDGVKFTVSSGTMASGVFCFYGYRK